jgi:multicomponent Na+:H+ antiporter subunit D
VFVGAACLYAMTGALNLGQLHAALPLDPTRAERLALALLIAGFATKAGLMPFHGWLPDAHSPVPGAVSALFSALMVGLGVVGLARVALDVVPQLHSIRILLSVIGIGSAVLGAVLALVQEDLKRLLAWDTVSQIGIIVAGLMSRVDTGVAGAVYHLIGHGLFKALLFLCAGAIVHATGVTSVYDMGGLARTRPLLTGAFVVGSAAIAGLPPLTGYGSLSLIHEGLHDSPALYVCALLAQVITVAALARAAYLTFFRRRGEAYDHLEPTRVGMRVSLLTLAACCVGFGVIAAPFVDQVAAPAAQVLLGPSRYAHAALAGGATHLPDVPVTVEYTSWTSLVPAFAEIVAGLLLAAVVIRTRAARFVTPLRRLHTGSVNDYAALALAGVAIVAFTTLS